MLFASKETSGQRLLLGTIARLAAEQKREPTVAIPRLYHCLGAQWTPPLPGTSGSRVPAQLPHSHLTEPGRASSLGTQRGSHVGDCKACSRCLRKSFLVLAVPSRTHFLISSPPRDRTCTPCSEAQSSLIRSKNTDGVSTSHLWALSPGLSARVCSRGADSPGSHTVHA